MRPAMSPDDLAPYRLLSGVAHSCLLASLLRTAFFQEVGSLLDYIAGWMYI